MSETQGHMEVDQMSLAEQRRNVAVQLAVSVGIAQNPPQGMDEILENSERVEQYLSAGLITAQDVPSTD